MPRFSVRKPAKGCQPMSSDSANRFRVSELISLLPGIHLRRLSKILGVQLSTIRYHVGRLEREGKVLCSRDGEYLRAYPVSVGEERESRTFALLQHRNAREVLKVLLESSVAGRGVTNNELAALAGLSGSTASKYIGEFRGLGLVRKVPAMEGHGVLEVNMEDRGRLSAMLSSYEKNYLSIITDRYVDLWDF